MNTNPRQHRPERNRCPQILLRQAPQAIDEVATAFRLSQGEQQFLLSAARGSGLLAVGADRAVFGSMASPMENALITTDPGELATTGADGDNDIDLHALLAMAPLARPDDIANDDDAESEEIVLHGAGGMTRHRLTRITAYSHYRSPQRCSETWNPWPR
ncbi:MULTISPECIES: hypothetical protein [Nocardia]|uniref:hypothetical protein n=1 Tax=Nocardia TaxID=1817 RepID=UPI0018E55491|nr:MULTISPECIES: hypothetical protein [Nocardia]